MGETFKRLRRWLTALFDFKDVIDVIRLGVSLTIGGGLVDAVSTILVGDPLWLQIVYLTGTGFVGFGVLMIATNKVRGRPIPKWRDRSADSTWKLPVTAGAEAVQGEVAQLQDSVETLKRERDQAREAVKELKGKVLSPEEEIHRKRELDGLYADNKKLRAKLEESTNEQAMFFPGHMDLESAHPIATQIQQARHVDGIWLAGEAVFQLDDAAIRGTVRRVILPAPDSPLLQEISRWTTIPYGAADLGVQQSTERAVRLGVEVKWLRDFPGLTLLLADPGDESGYAHLETLLPYTDPGYRPIQRIERARESVVFDRVVNMFDRLWERAESPAPADYIQQPGSREPVLRLQEVVQNGRAVRLLWEFVEVSLLPAVNAANTAGSYLGLFIKEDVVGPLKRTAEEWRTASSDTEGDPVEAQQAFLNMYKAWHDLRWAVDRCRQILNVPELGHLEGFVDWYLESVDFRERLQGVLSRDDLYGLKQSIRSYHDDNPAVAFVVTP